jgi:hypothetical protein
MRGRGLPFCGRGVTVPISTKPKPSRNSASGTSPFLSKPGATADRIWKIEAEYAGGEFRVVRLLARQRRQLQARESQPVSILRIERVQERPRQTIE